MLFQKHCTLCGAEFLAGPNAKYCRDCARERQRKSASACNQKRFHAENPEARVVGSTQVCEVCGKDYVLRSGNQKTCEDCRKKPATPHLCATCGKPCGRFKYCVDCNPRKNLTSTQKRYAQEDTPCRLCGKPFKKESGNQKFCAACREKRKQKEPSPIRCCMFCGAPLENSEESRKGPKQLYCPACAWKRRQEESRNRRLKKGVVPVGSIMFCENCGQSFTKEQSRQKYCKICSRESKELGKPRQKTGLLPDEDRFKLVGGPYYPPAVRRDAWLMDEERGNVCVGGYSEGRIPWPRVKKTGTASLILCGDLVRAVKTESALAIKYWFGVGDGVIARWRKTLKVKQTGSEGSRRLYQQYKPRKLTEERVERARENAKSEESRAKSSVTKTGQPAHPSIRAGLLRAAKQPKSEEWKKQHSLNMQLQWAIGVRKGTPWTQEHKEQARKRMLQQWANGDFPQVWTPEKEAQLVRLKYKGLTHPEIAELMGMTEDAITSHLREMRRREE